MRVTSCFSHDPKKKFGREIVVISQQSFFYNSQHYPSSNLKPVEVHDFVPCGDKVADELLLRVVAAINLGDGA